MLSKIISFIQALGFTVAVVAILFIGPILGVVAIVGFILWLAYMIIQDSE